MKGPWLSAMGLACLLMMSAHAESWDSDNDPKLFSSDFEYHWSALPLKASLPEHEIPWADTYWPSYLGSINYRWHSDHPVGFNYHSPTQSEASSMSRAELEKLSPSEKYDLAMGDYSYSLRDEAKWHANPRAKDWVGICHGWAPAAIQFKEPKIVEVVNPDGIVVPFGSSDVKGLISYFFAFHGGIRYSFVGLRCALAKISDSKTPCGDVNPGALHVILTNQIGLKQQGFMADVEQAREVWNQPIYGYEITPVASVKSDHAASAVQVKLTMLYTDELDKPLWEAVGGTSQFPIGKLEMEYVLELDSEGRITGGEWIGPKHPDFLWKANSKAHFSGAFEGLNRIYQPMN